MYDNEFKTTENNIWTKDKIEPQHRSRFTEIKRPIHSSRKITKLEFHPSQK